MKKGMKKVLAVLLGTAMTASLFTGCGSKDSDSAGSKGNETDTEKDASVEIDKTDTAAEDIDISEHVDLRMYLVGDKPEGFDDVYAKINEILDEKLNCSLTVDWLSWAEHGTKYSLLFSGGEDFDMIYTASSWCHYEQTVGLGGFMALSEDFIKTYAPDVWEMEPCATQISSLFME